MASYPLTEETRQQILSLHTEKKLGIKAISAWFKGKPGRSTIAKVLSEAGVYEGPDRVAEQIKQQRERRERVVSKEKKNRNRMAFCLRHLRLGIPIATTCRQQGWSKTSVLNRLNERPIYRRWRERNEKPRKRPASDYKNGWVSREFPHEDRFQRFICDTFRQNKIEFVQEYRVPGLKSRADFLVQNFLIECKVDVRTGSMNEAIGQSLLYQLATKRKVILLLPRDVMPQPIHLEALKTISVELWRPADLLSWVEGVVKESFNNQRLTLGPQAAHFF